MNHSYILSRHSGFCALIIFASALGLLTAAADDLPRSPLYVVRRGDRLGFMDRAGNITIPARFQHAEDFFEGVACVKLNDVWAFIDESGKVVLKFPDYTHVWSFREGLAMVEIQRDDQVEGLRGFIDHSGHLVIPLKFLVASSFSEGLAAAKDTSGRWGFIDKSGAWMIQPQFESADTFREGWAVVRQNSYEGAVDSTGKFVIPPLFVLIGGFDRGLACARPKDSAQFGLIDRAGSLVVAPRFDWCDGFTEGFARVQLDDKWGYLNSAGELVIPPRFEEAHGFEEGLAAVKVGERWGFVNTAGELVIPPQYADASSFKMGVVAVDTGDKWLYIDRKGEFVQILRLKDEDELRESRSIETKR